MRTLFANAHIVTMDDAGTEIPNGWLLVDDGFVEEVGQERARARAEATSTAARMEAGERVARSALRSGRADGPALSGRKESAAGASRG